MSRAAEYYRRAAEREYAPGQTAWGYCLEKGQGTEADEKAAVRQYQAAAGQEDPMAMYRLGLCLAEGRGIDTDLAAGMSYIKRAAEKGVRQAREYLESGGSPDRKSGAARKTDPPARKKGWLGKLFGK